MTTQTWPPSRKVHLQSRVEQKRSPGLCRFDTAEKRPIQTSRLENKHLSKKTLFKEYF